MRFTGQDGLFMAAWSQDSGIGKTTALKVAQAVWGHPIRAMQGLDDTQNSVMNKIGELNSLPMYWDELKTEEDTKKFVGLTFRITSGREKSRMTQAVKQREAGLWQTMMVSASNDSVMSYVINRTSTTPAGMARIFEFVVTPGVKGRIEPSVAQRTIARLNDNFGQVGLRYAEFLGNNADRCDREMDALLKELGAEVKTVEEERFWMALIGCLLLGARYANELGFTAIDEAALKKFLLEALAKMRGERLSQPVDMRIAMNVSDKLAQFLNAMQARHTIVTNRIHIVAGKPPAGSIKVMRDTSRLDGIYVHIGVDDKLLRISSTFLSEWLAEKNYSRHVFTDALEREFGCRRVRGRIASGTQFAGATEHLLEIPLAGSPLTNFIDEA